MMKRIIQILFLGLVLSVSTAAMAGQDRNRDEGYRGDQRHNTYQFDRHDDHRHDRNGHRHYVNYDRHARRHTHHGRYCYDWHPRGYIAPVVRYAYAGPGLVIVYEPRTGLFIGDGR